jgi:hypothetical protein
MYREDDASPIVTALATMVGLVKSADAVKYCGAIVGMAIVVILLVVCLWSSMSLWQKVVSAAMGFGVCWVRRERHRPRKKREEE